MKHTHPSALTFLRSNTMPVARLFASPVIYKHRNFNLQKWLMHNHLNLYNDWSKFWPIQWLFSRIEPWDFAIGRVLPITIFITTPWTSCQLGVKSVFVAKCSLYHKPILSTNGAARRQRNGFPALWKKLKRSGSPRSIEKWKVPKHQWQKGHQIKVWLSNKI